ncbi:MAG: hypothetical protein RIE77_10365 [Phycisphaerales bacterium]|jgi:hypothetical protein
MARGATSVRRIKLICIAVFQLLVAGYLWLYLLAMGAKANRYQSTEAASAIIDALQARGELAVPQARDEANDQLFVIANIVMEPIVDGRVPLLWATVALASFGLLFLLLALLPDCWLQRSRPSDEPLA